MDFTPFDRDQSASPSRSYVRCMLVRSRRDLPANSNARGIPERSGRVLTINADGALAPASRSRGRRRNQVGRIVVSEMPGWVVLLRSPSAFRDWQGPGTRLKSIQQPGRLPADCFGHMRRRSWRPTPEHSVWRAARPPCAWGQAAFRDKSKKGGPVPGCDPFRARVGSRVARTRARSSGCKWVTHQS